MKFKSKIELTPDDISEILIKHFEKVGKPGIVHTKVSFNVDSGGYDGPFGWSPAKLISAEVTAEMEVDD